MLIGRCCTPCIQSTILHDQWGKAAPRADAADAGLHVAQITILVQAGPGVHRVWFLKSSCNHLRWHFLVQGFANPIRPVKVMVALFFCTSPVIHYVPQLMKKGGQKMASGCVFEVLYVNLHFRSLQDDLDEYIAQIFDLVSSWLNLVFGWWKLKVDFERGWKRVLGWRRSAWCGIWGWYLRCQKIGRMQLWASPLVSALKGALCRHHFWEPSMTVAHLDIPP